MDPDPVFFHNEEQDQNGLTSLKNVRRLGATSERGIIEQMLRNGQCWFFC